MSAPALQNCHVLHTAPLPEHGASCTQPPALPSNSKYRIRSGLKLVVVVCKRFLEKRAIKQELDGLPLADDIACILTQNSQCLWQCFKIAYNVDGFVCSLLLSLLLLLLLLLFLFSSNGITVKATVSIRQWGEISQVTDSAWVRSKWLCKFLPTWIYRFDPKTYWLFSVFEELLSEYCIYHMYERVISLFLWSSNL